MVPHIELHGSGGITRRVEVDYVMRDRYNIFVGADPVHLWRNVIRQISCRINRSKSPPGMRVASHPALTFCPLKYRKCPRWPLLNGGSVGIIILFQVKKDDVSCMR